MALRMLNEAKADKKLEGIVADLTNLEEMLGKAKGLAEAAVAAVPDAAPDDSSARAPAEGEDRMDITGDEGNLDEEALNRVCAAAGLLEPTDDQKRKISEQLGSRRGQKAAEMMATTTALTSSP